MNYDSTKYECRETFDIRTKEYRSKKENVIITTIDYMYFISIYGSVNGKKPRPNLDDCLSILSEFGIYEAQLDDVSDKSISFIAPINKEVSNAKH